MAASPQLRPPAVGIELPSDSGSLNSTLRSRPAEVFPVAADRAARFAHRIDQFIGAFRRAVDHHQLGDAGIEQRRGDAACGATGTDQQHAAATQVQAVAVGQVAHQADAIGGVTVPAVALAQQGVDRAGAARPCG
ncbi:hypothetical protein G6F22_020368 [Rhizopus arrhizus]|nr:hypothetical protein G6F22_020368 [Rhizopus arrhizus]